MEVVKAAVVAAAAAVPTVQGGENRAFSDGCGRAAMGGEGSRRPMATAAAADSSNGCRRAATGGRGAGGGGGCPGGAER